MAHSIDLSSTVNYGTAINLDFDTKLRELDNDDSDESDPNHVDDALDLAVD